MARDYRIYCVLVVVLVIGEIVKGDAEVSDDGNKDLVLTYRQKTILDQFKKRVSHRLPHDYMKEDVYLIRWLRAKKFDISNAEEALMENIKWRKEFRMDEIQNEDFSDVKESCPIYTDTVARNGQPVATMLLCDMRQGFVSGRERRVIRYIFQRLDNATTLIREAQKAGKNITRFDVVQNLDGFNLVQHGCPRCMLAFLEVIRMYDRNYPEFIERFIVINAPSYISNLFGPVVRAATSGGGNEDSVDFKIFGTDRGQWKRYLLQLIDENQLPEEVGGRRVRY